MKPSTNTALWIMRFGFALLVVTLGLTGARAAGIADLAVVKPVVSCQSLSSADLSGAAGAPVTITAVKTVNLPVGAFCRVQGNVAPTVGFEVDLPISTWQQRFLENGCGGLCGVLIPPSVTNASTCTPALTGGLVVSSDDMGHSGISMSDGSFGTDPQKRIDFAYRGNHVTALVSKALIKIFYGQAPRYSYFTGCSDGGREALVEAERFPGDFDGISAGAPAMNFVIQNSFYHAWQSDSNTRPDGTHILLADRLPILHAAAIAACGKQERVTDGLIPDPRACNFDPAVAECPADASDTSSCLTAEEVAVARKLYDGPTDEAGRPLTVGGPLPGSELAWVGLFVPRSATANLGSAGMAANTSQYVIFPDTTPADGDIPNFPFTEANFARASILAPLYDATDTDLSPFQEKGGKLILWQGWSDQRISPMNTIAYYQALNKQMGTAAVDSFTRLFLFPGIYHCGGGEGYTQFDLLSPLMAWVEGGDAPSRIIAAKVSLGPHVYTPPPLPQPGGTPIATRPVFAYPMVATYSGHGDVNDAASYVPVRSQMADVPARDWEGASLYAPSFLKSYTVVDGKLTISHTK